MMLDLINPTAFPDLPQAYIWIMDFCQGSSAPGLRGRFQTCNFWTLKISASPGAGPAHINAARHSLHSRSLSTWRSAQPSKMKQSHRAPTMPKSSTCHLCRSDSSSPGQRWSPLEEPFLKSMSTGYVGSLMKSSLQYSGVDSTGSTSALRSFAFMLCWMACKSLPVTS